MADDSFRLLSFTFARRSFRYTTGNRQRPRLARVKSDYGASGITSSFSKDTIIPVVWSRNSRSFMFSAVTIRHPSVYITSMSWYIHCLYLIVHLQKGLQYLHIVLTFDRCNLSLLYSEILLGSYNTDFMYLSSIRFYASKGLVIYDHFVRNDFRYTVRLSTNNVFLIIFLLKFMNIIYYHEINYLQFKFLYMFFNFI